MYRIRLVPLLGLLVLAASLMACNSSPNRAPVVSSCNPPQGHNLPGAFRQARQDLGAGCATHFDAYFSQLLNVAEGDPSPDNKRRFSEFLEWAADEGIISKRQARRTYNRYFNVKFVSLMSDYSTCSRTCPSKDRVVTSLERELGDKELGLLRVSNDRAGYQRADRLFRETELVLEATCSACSAIR